MSYFHHIERNNKKSSTKTTDIYLGENVIGHVKPVIYDVVKTLFRADEKGLHFLSTTREDCEKTIEEALILLKDAGIVSSILEERLEVSLSIEKMEMLFTVSRTAMSPFGFLSYGIHVNGYMIDEETGELSIWVATRAKGKGTYPGMLDQIIAGAQPANLSFHENLLKESYEEAGFSEDIITKQTNCTGYISYIEETETKYYKSIIINYDLKLKAGQIPKNTDGEVESFKLYSVQEVLELLNSKDELFKPNCALVMIDFLIRHSVLTIDNCSEYLLLCNKLRAF